MKTKEHSEELRENVIEKHKSGHGYKKISKALNIPLSTAKAIIKKWKEYGTSLNLPRTGHPPKLRKIVKIEPVAVTKNYNVKTKEHSLELRENVIEKHKSGHGYKKISKALNIPLSSVQAMIKKWKEYGTSINLPRTGRPRKVSKSVKSELVAPAKNCTVKTKEHSLEIRENIIEKNKSGDGYKTISKALNIPVSSVQAIIKKRKEYGTSINLPRTGRPRKVSKSVKTEPVKVAKNCTVKTKEHSLELRENVVEKHKSGHGYKKISKALNIPLSTAKAIIKKWKEYGTSINLPRTGRPRKVSKSVKTEPVKEAKNCTVKTKEHSLESRENVIEKYKSGDGYKKISKSLNIPVSSVQAIIKKWRQYGTCVNLRRAGRPSKLRYSPRKGLVLSFFTTSISCSESNEC